MMSDVDSVLETKDMEVVRSGYPALGSISAIMRVLGWVIIVCGVLLSLFYALALAALGDGVAIVLGVAIFLGGTLMSVIMGIFVLALADLIVLLVDVERNTRAAALNLAEIE